jgi:hypothetical protein
MSITTRVELVMPPQSRDRLLDIPTLIAISVIAWALADILHEIVGHGGAAALMGFDVRAASTTTVFFTTDLPYHIEKDRFFNAAGALVNLLTGALALVLLCRCASSTASWRFFLWLFACFSATIVAVNLVSAPILGGGDWTAVLRGLEPSTLWKSSLIGTGLFLAVIGYVLPLRFFMPDLRDRRLVQLGLTAVPVLTVIIFHTLSLLKSPFSRLPADTNHLLASVFMYLHLILWIILVNVLPWPRSSDPADRIRLRRSYVWIVVGFLVLLVYVVILGPGIGSFEGDHRLI